jgi:SAM-dependent methyltransferase
LALRSIIPRRAGARIKTVAEGPPSAVDSYWSEHTVNSTPFQRASDSLAYLDWRFEQYPLFREFMDLWGDHSGQVVLDYGCGPGNDLVGFLLFSGASRVVGVDVSPKALEIARGRLALHRVPRERVELLLSADAAPGLPLADGSVDYVHCAGVLHHVSAPEATLAELGRLLPQGGRATVMVYNYDSVWLHLYTAYVKMIREGAFAGLTLVEAFGRNTDGEECPIARCYRAPEFAALAERTAFECEYVGGYPARFELELLDRYWGEALASRELGEEHRTFLASLERDAAGLPLFSGKHAGVGGVYRLRKL